MALVKNCVQFSKAGAKKVVGVDISKNMLSIATAKYQLDDIEYINMDMSDISSINQRFDFVYSSLAFHYAENFEKLIADIYNMLNLGGKLLFSQEHPIITASNSENGGYYITSNDMPKAYALTDYAKCGKRSGEWYVNDVENYHRRFSDIINTLCKCGFVIEEICEPLPDEYALSKRKGLAKEFIKPTFLIVKAVKR